MRLFVAIEFSETEKDEIYHSVEQLKETAEGGNFTKKENLHLTLVFIGETAKAANARRALKQVAFAPFLLELTGRIGVFKRGNKGIYWMEIKESASLKKLQKAVAAALETFGFCLEKRPFVPHLTLGREVPLLETPLSGRAVTAAVSSISLMKSERIRGRLQYIPVFRLPALPEEK